MENIIINKINVDKDILKEMNSIFSSKLKDEDYIRLETEYNKSDYTTIKKIHKMIKFDYVISIRGCGYWGELAKQNLHSIGDGNDFVNGALKKSLDKIKNGFKEYEITVYLTPKNLEKINDTRLENEDFVKNDVKDKIYRAYDIEIDTTKVSVNYGGYIY